jgi:hypothetical protein
MLLWRVKESNLCSCNETWQQTVCEISVSEETSDKTTVFCHIAEITLANWPTFQICLLFSSSGRSLTPKCPSTQRLHCAISQKNITFKIWFGVLWFWRLLVGLSPRRPVFASGSVHVGFVVDEVTMWQVFLRVIRVSSVWPYVLINYWGTNNTPVGDPSSDTSSHHIDMNKDNISVSCSMSYSFIIS